MPYVVTSDCILCGACEAGCESNAISEGATQMIIDINVCVECGSCERNCPVSAIIFEDDTSIPG
jgi:ferredoxin